MALPTDERAQMNQELYRKWRDARSTWDTDARMDVDFFLGNHFTTSESSELSSRSQADIPMDRVSPAVEKLKSVLTSRPPIFTVIPREDSDSQVAHTWRHILGYVWDISDGDHQVKQAIADYAVTGMGYLYAYIDREEDFGRGDVKFTYVDPFRVYVPPSTRDRWFVDAEGIILSTILTGEQIINLYPELDDTIDEEGNVTSHTFNRRVIEPGTDVSSESDVIKALVTEHHSDELISNYTEYLEDPIGNL